MAHVVGVVNQKGGVGKTTTAVNVAAALCAAELRVLLVDCDAQGNATTGLGGDKMAEQNHLYDLMMGACRWDQAAKRVVPGLSLIPSTPHLSGVEVELATLDGWENRLKEALAPAQDVFDVILLDSPPSLGMVTVNILAAAHRVLVPLQCEFYALEGLSQLWRTLQMTRKRINPDLEVLGIVLTMFESRHDLNRQVADEVRKHFGELVCDAVIPRDIRMGESPSFARPVLWYGSETVGSKAYLKLGNELMARLGLHSF
ncbi:chromosome segregation ATPase [Magnetococcus marinus MC-1]|uniref:Chromosome segregation ATPase n=1 Tax=Magnetococcus marinus (strain ATCC BAA-1437 / JCM 17883 / MC-1) TaxID=156889 RepID=A0LE43_MAGMM|nr:ParA family protein [Magnetococcus marinus]ABK46236.1 chromosome segregation ATPase [Magnetococcus marinus MC-1]